MGLIGSLINSLQHQMSVVYISVLSNNSQSPSKIKGVKKLH